VTYMTNVFVHIIESPSAADLLGDQVEGRALCNALELARIPHAYSLATNKEMFRKALMNPLAGKPSNPLLRESIPILHLSMHGNADGVGLTSGEFISWNQLRSDLAPLLAGMGGHLLICMSSCDGAMGCRMAMNDETFPSFGALVGNTKSVDWGDAAVAYISFYHQYFKYKPIEECVRIMREASGDDNFFYVSSEAAKQAWVNASSVNS
jgi:hypothetical protein